MKRIEKLWLLVCALCALTACESSQNYSKQLESEQNKIDAWLQRNGYVVQTVCPPDSAFVIGQWYHLGSEEIYFCIDSIGSNVRIHNGDELIVRYVESTLDELPIVHSYWTTLDKPNPDIITKGSTINSCEGWDNAFDVMRYSGTIAQVIVPSKKGFSAATSSVVPYHYKLLMRKVAK